MYPYVEYITVLRVKTLIASENKMAGRTMMHKIHGFKLITDAQTAFSWVISSNSVTVESGGCFLNGFIIYEG